MSSTDSRAVAAVRIRGRVRGRGLQLRKPLSAAQVGADPQAGLGKREVSYKH